MEYVKNNQGDVVFLDQEKAYDRVSHVYLFAIFDLLKSATN